LNPSMGPKSRSEPAGEIGGKAAKNIESILQLEQEDREELSPLHRISHGVGWFVGTYPFSLLSVVLSTEAMLLTLSREIAERCRRFRIADRVEILTFRPQVWAG
jgi:hypothetical protein